MQRLAGGLAVLALLPACGQGASDGGVRALAKYDVIAVADDQPNLDGSGFERSLDFTFGAMPATRAGCASLEGATVTFAGRFVPLSNPGGWTVKTIPANTAPGETMTIQACDMPSLYVGLDAAAVEPQNGVLAIDGDGAHFELPFHHDFGDPEVTLVSAAFSEIVVELKGFAPLPPIDEIVATLWVPASVSAGPAKTARLPNDALSPDGRLTIAIPRGTIGGATHASLSVSVHLGDEMPACAGFHGCRASSYVLRTVSVDIPGP